MICVYLGCLWFWCANHEDDRPQNKESWDLVCLIWVCSVCKMIMDVDLCCGCVGATFACKDFTVCCSLSLWLLPGNAIVVLCNLLLDLALMYDHIPHRFGRLNVEPRCRWFYEAYFNRIL
ncbi:hypothetical protein L1987_85374 [Smallanthus sonchifolius]|uniref:Uncharacterized protein n=1 Tax=Smallanthus sonchifolius TaxID=185202 RepID=A0ACB8XWK5_9ASTR|nr:hypothetical protein L1987_85374 [Smallanthus sonchifolius]